MEARPKMYCTYYFYDANGAVLYIGCTRSVLDRIKAHAMHSWFYRDVVTIKIERALSFKEAVAFESKEIRRLRPIYNSIGEERAAITRKHQKERRQRRQSN